ncbi:MAG TPA: hypothetical protein VF407_06725 [Polyangiaceae bacterium]
MRASFFRLALALPTIFVAVSARADETVDDARSEYDLGSKDLDANRYAPAAAHFARADALVPNAVVLELALRTVLRSDAGPLAMELADRAETRGVDAALAKQARARFVRTTGRIVVRCPDGSTCSARVDERLVPNEAATWVTAGDHAIELTVDGHVDRNTLRVDPGATLDVRPLTLRSPPPPEASKSPPPSTTTSSRPVPAIVYGLGAGTLAGFGVWGVFGISGLYGSPSLRTLKECNPYCSQSDADAVHTKLLVGDIGFGVGVASTALAVVFYLTRPRVTTTTTVGGPNVSFDAHGAYAGWTWTR